ncbi:phosphatase PAP2 family protein [Natronomonas sp.]|uniref:phosphatase PAP2 family protein n=1 Tax=Natronomonas sp. TaxID=2184060 RepID=UPI0026393B57|nr:phosphatase PAP2 family protein [Natronomonas sp.]
MATAPISEFLQYVRWMDARAVEFVVGVRSPQLTEVMNSVTGLGSVTAGLVFVGLFYLAGWREEFLVTIVSLSVLGVVVGALMSLVQRPFPPQPICMTGDDAAVTSSFPSGHAAAVTVYATVARSSERLPFAVVSVLAAAIAFSRVYLGTHYLSDTVFGIGIGIAAALFAEWAVGRTDVDALLARVPFEVDL